jgi:hypothetical protein
VGEDEAEVDKVVHEEEESDGTDVDVPEDEGLSLKDKEVGVEVAIDAGGAEDDAACSV